MPSKHNILHEIPGPQWDLPDPGDAGALPRDKMGIVNIVTATTETRTLADPTRSGIWLILNLQTDNGDCTVSGFSAIDDAGTTSFVLDDAGDSVFLLSRKVGSGYRWRVVGSLGSDLSAGELAFLDGVTAGTAAASKALVLDSSKDIATIHDITLNGNLTWSGATTANIVTIPTNLADALSVVDAAGDLIVVDTSTGTQVITITPATTVSGGLTVDTVTEDTAASGVTIDSGVIRDGQFHGVQPTPTAETGAATITIADILTGIVTISQSTTSTVALTVDTGTAMDTGMPASFGVGQFIDWAVINISTGNAGDTATLTAADGHTLVGTVLIPANESSTGAVYGSSALFRSRRTGVNTWVTYRIA